jgi:hypothetical protein
MYGGQPPIEELPAARIISTEKAPIARPGSPVGGGGFWETLKRIWPQLAVGIGGSALMGALGGREAFGAGLAGFAKGTAARAEEDRARDFEREKMGEEARFRREAETRGEERWRAQQRQETEDRLRIEKERQDREAETHAQDTAARERMHQETLAAQRAETEARAKARQEDIALQARYRAEDLKARMAEVEGLKMAQGFGQFFDTAMRPGSPLEGKSPDELATLYRELWSKSQGKTLPPPPQAPTFTQVPTPLLQQGAVGFGGAPGPSPRAPPPTVGEGPGPSRLGGPPDCPPPRTLQRNRRTGEFRCI